MVRHVEGARGQIVTTWGRDLDGDLWVGPDRPLTTVITCRCGKEVQHAGFASATEAHRLGLVAPLPHRDGHPSEWFCSLQCAAKHEPEAMQQAIRAAEDSGVASLYYADHLQDVLDSVTAS